MVRTSKDEYIQVYSLTIFIKNDDKVNVALQIENEPKKKQRIVCTASNCVLSRLPEKPLNTWTNF